MIDAEDVVGSCVRVAGGDDKFVVLGQHNGEVRLRHCLTRRETSALLADCSPASPPEHSVLKFEQWEEVVVRNASLFVVTRKVAATRYERAEFDDLNAAIEYAKTRLPALVYASTASRRQVVIGSGSFGKWSAFWNALLAARDGSIQPAAPTDHKPARRANSRRPAKAPRVY